MRDQNRDASGRYDTEPRCDCCGATCGARVGSHYTDAEICGLGDGPGFYLCGRKKCIAKREQLSIDERRELYRVGRERNEQNRKDRRKMAGKRTKEDARQRVRRASVGALESDCSDEYLRGLIHYVTDWQESILEFMADRAEQQKEESGD